MIITKEQMNVWFKRFNKEYFNNELPTPQLKTSKALKNSLGRFSYRSRNLSYAGYSDMTYDWKITISTFYDREEKHLMETMLHEMIHEYTLHKYSIVDHGYRFKNECNRLKRYGWNISTVTDLCNELGYDKFEHYMELKHNGNIKQDRWVAVVQHLDYDFVCCIPKKYGTKSIRLRENCKLYDMKNKYLFDKFPNTGTGSTLRGKNIKKKDDLHKIIFDNLIEL